MKRYPALVAALLLTLSLSAQTTPAEFAARYDRLVARVGIAGAGVETLLERWEEAFPGTVISAGSPCSPARIPPARR